MGMEKVFSDALNQALFLARHTPYQTDQGPKVKQEDVTWKNTKIKKIRDIFYKWVYHLHLAKLTLWFIDSI